MLSSLSSLRQFSFDQTESFSVIATSFPLVGMEAGGGDGSVGAESRSGAGQGNGGSVV